MRVGLVLEVVGIAEPIAVLVDVEPMTAVDELASALARHVGTVASPPPACTIRRSGVEFRDRSTVGQLELRHGDRVRVGATRARNRAGAAAPVWELLVVGGPGTGARWHLVAGQHTIGRDARADIPLRDEQVSRRHVRVDVGTDAVHVEDVGSTNGTFVDGRRVDGRYELAIGEILEVGDTLLAVDKVRDLPSGAFEYRDGRLSFNRPPRVARPYDPPTFALPVPPRRADKARLPLAASIVPILMGVVMFLLLRNSSFLLFMALGPVMAVFSVVDSRRGGRSDYRTKLAAFDHALDSTRSALAAAHDAGVHARRRAHPPLAELAARATRGAPELWERRARDDDFLSVRVGTADQPTSLTVDAPDGDDAPAQRARALRDEYAIDPLVPVALDLGPGHVVGIVGDAPNAEAIARGLVVQVACLHSPRELVVAVFAVGPRGPRWEWAHWLPHTETVIGTVERGAVATSADARQLFARLHDLVAARASATGSGRGSSPSPHVLAVFTGEPATSVPELSELFGLATDGGMSALVVRASRAELPGECDQIITAGATPGDSRVTITASGVDVSPVVVDLVDHGVAAETALALAGIRDAGHTESEGALPAQIGLLELLGAEDASPEGVRQGWRNARALRATIGAGRRGPFTIDLRRDGPHALVAGTTGAGKSELLQTLVGSLALSSPPARLAFVLVDYKGGAAFKDCAALPHTVGFFTDLDAHLAQRALLSLNAELRRREEILRATGTKDIEELEARGAELAPPSLVIVFDEFAFLKREVPAFVDGVVDIAQRGRSLGIHLVLATQRPTGVVDDHIRANTSLRIALRVNDDHESTDVIGRNDAARLPRDQPGRALVRTGHGEVHEIQTAFAGHLGAARTTTATLAVRAFPSQAAMLPTGSDAPPAGASDLKRLVEAVGAAAELEDYERQPSPWLAPLEPAYPLAALAGRVDGDLVAMIGVLDEPALQRQSAFGVDLAAVGHLMVYGTGGAGKTTLLRTIAASLASRYGPSDLLLYGLDCASLALRSIEVLPQCGGAVAARDAELVEQLFARIDEEMSQRRTLLGARGAGSLAELRARGEDGLPPSIVVLLDDWGGFAAAFESVDRGELLDAVGRQVADGGALGIHFVITASRRSGLPAALTAQIARAVVLRLADEDEYAWLGLDRTAGDVVLGPGRGFTDAGVDLQVAVAGDGTTGAEQARDLSALAENLAPSWSRVPRLAPAPREVARASMPAPEPNVARVALGIDARTLAPVWADFEDQPVFLVAGPDRSGRSTALTTLASGFVDAFPACERVLIAPRRTPLRDMLGWTELADADGAGAALQRLLAALADDPTGEVVRLCVVDDADELTDGVAANALEQLLRRARNGGVVVLMAAPTHTLHRSFGGFLADARRAKHGIVLQADAEVDGDLFAVRFPRKTTRAFPPGRGYLVQRATMSYVQVGS